MKIKNCVKGTRVLFKKRCPYGKQEGELTGVITTSPINGLLITHVELDKGGIVAINPHFIKRI